MKAPCVASSPTTIAVAINLTGNERDVRGRNRHADAAKPMLEMSAKMANATAMRMIEPGGAIKRLPYLEMKLAAFLTLGILPSLNFRPNSICTISSTTEFFQQVQWAEVVCPPRWP